MGAYYDTCSPTPFSIWKKLGFGSCWVELKDEEFPGMPPGAIATDTQIRLGFLDRLRVLISGKVYVALKTKTDVIVETAISKSAVSVLPPTWKMSRE